MVPIVSYNYGAKHKDRLMKTVKISIIYAIIIMIIGLCIFQIFPKELLSLFSASQEMINIGIPALRIISLSVFICRVLYSCIFHVSSPW